jgi:hypothetical protein
VKRQEQLALLLRQVAKQMPVLESPLELALELALALAPVVVEWIKAAREHYSRRPQDRFPCPRYLLPYQLPSSRPAGTQP